MTSNRQKQTQTQVSSGLIFSLLLLRWSLEPSASTPDSNVDMSVLCFQSLKVCLFLWSLSVHADLQRASFSSVRTQTMTWGGFCFPGSFIVCRSGAAAPVLALNNSHIKINTAPLSASLKYSQYPEVINTELTKISSPHIQNTKTTQRFVILRLGGFFLGFFFVFFFEILFHKFQTCTHEHLRSLHVIHRFHFFFKLNSHLELFLNKTGKS